MTNQTNWQEHISDLTEDDRKTMEEHVKSLPHILRQLELRVEDYGSGTPDSGTVSKFVQHIEIVRDWLGRVRKDLIEKHKLPDVPFR